MRTHTGRFIDPFNLTMADICIEDIAHHLSNVCRFNGATLHHYSVAQHSVYVSSLCPAELKLEGLLHDASEAYLTDVPRPIKYREEFGFYRELEQRVQGTIFQRFGIIPFGHERVKVFDDQMLVTEGIALMNYRYDMADPAKVDIEELAPAKAKAQFLKAYHTLISMWVA